MSKNITKFEKDETKTLKNLVQEINTLDKEQQEEKKEVDEEEPIDKEIKYPSKITGYKNETD